MLYKIINGSVTLGNKTILEEINFEVKTQEKVAIVGKNGCGKSTLLKAIIGEEELDKGLGEEDLDVIKLGISRLGYIKQDAIMDNGITMLDEILKSYSDILEVEKKLEKLENNLKNNYNEKLLNKYQDLYLYYKNIGGYSYKKEYETAIKMFGFSEEDKYKKLGEFSYGQRTKIALLRLVLSKPDLLLLDEPTNHLDMNAIEWLENYLRDYPKMLIVVSHDRMLIDNVCNITYEIEYGSLVKYCGNYSYYEKQKKLNYEKNLKDFERQQKEIERLRGIADRFRYKPNKASMALSKLKQIERMVKIDKPSMADNRTFISSFQPKIESYRDVLKVKDLCFGYDKVLGKVNFCLERGERIGIIGENGCGKSTLLKTIMGDILKLGGKFTFGNKVEIGYFDQNVESLDEEKVVLDIMRDEFPLVDVVELRNMLGGFEFYGDMVFQYVSSLSGGEKVKLLLCKIMRHQPNLLILDEPTNHLDIIGKETIEKLLLQYKGTVIFISHDRYFVKKVATKLLVFEGNQVNYYDGDYNYYLEKKVSFDSVDNNKEISNVTESKKYVSDFKERSKLERKAKRMEDEIQQLEDKINSYHNDMMKEEVYLDINKVRDIENKINELNIKLEDNMIEWEEIMKALEI